MNRDWYGRTEKMKRVAAILLFAVLLGSLLPAAGAENETGTPDDLQTAHLTVGNPTALTGEFFTDLWGNATSDADVRSLLHGYGLVRWDPEEGGFAVNHEAVEEATVQNDAGNKSYIFVLHDDLYYSDGTKITARDYAFSVLLQISPEIAALGAEPARKEYLYGYEDYISGKTQELSGVRILDEDILMITIDHRYLPFFYETGLLMFQPYPIYILAPGVTVKDDGNGVYLANENENTPQPVFSAALLEETLNNPVLGYRHHPAVVSGPYTLTKWDGVTAEFAANPWYRGNADGETARLRSLTYTLADNETMIAGLETGAFDLVNKVVREDVVGEGIRAVGDGSIAMSNYPRSGLSCLAFACEKKPVDSRRVRQAVAWCMDRDAITEAYTGDFGQRVDGYFGLGQWMFGLMNGTVEPPVEAPENEADPLAEEAYETELKKWEALNLDGLTEYCVDTEKARVLLGADGWFLNPDGVMQKFLDGEWVTLELTMLYPEGSEIGPLLEKYFVPNLREAGIRLTLQGVPMQELLAQYYGRQERTAEMMFLGSNFDMVYDPSVTFAPADNTGYRRNPTRIDDPVLYDLAVQMRETEPGDVLTYMQRWIAFEERFNEVLPMLPVYTNVYFDFYNAQLQNYQISENTTWGEAVADAYYESSNEQSEENSDE